MYLQVELGSEPFYGGFGDRPVPRKIVPVAALVAQHQVELLLDGLIWDEDSPCTPQQTGLLISSVIAPPLLPDGSSFLM